MTAQSWRSLRTKKYQLSLQLFLFLNLFSALFALVNPLYNVSASMLPVVLITLCGAALFLWHWRFPQKKINISFISLTFGCLWAWHVGVKTLELHQDNSSYVIIALLTLLFIGAIAFSNNIIAFTLHSLPIVITCLVVSRGEQWPRMAYCFVLPMIGIAIQHLIQKRNDGFAQGLMYQLMEERETLNDLSMLDPLTGLYNRRGLHNRLDALLAMESAGIWVLLLDIDHFKAYNDHYGHMMGDKALIQVSAAIRNAVRSRDVVTRYGGEEFMVLLTNSNAQSALQAAERIRQQVYDLKIPHMFNESVATNVTVSIGVAPLEGNDLESALEKADKALYEAKHLGRNNILTSDHPLPT
ncbi:GGDEF domain-containing protein [Yokenella regensburgei]|uniref:diguanylate cyclase n=1 Tax=Yokenella regensburgei TaxID=158877 RepID=A0AB38FV56_9ENTR|nr:GGDEF domain-containing protein [Yokenella regensburgei]KFD25177.1 putative membrane protein [Yokenella regensburgei ATCC 49455]SQA63213.1 Probable diguanylate cyclase AdrA [Yokenella regensburgei]SQA68633.1 Probable diguanylate cyclase AdrA [Yokenella regensburgei]SUQ06948.1 Probable diguanylate cyclase AdrA [Yokenella regensburgei]